MLIMNWFRLSVSSLRTAGFSSIRTPFIFKTLVSRYMRALERNPVRVKMIQSLVIASFGDIIAQRLTADSKPTESENAKQDATSSSSHSAFPSETSLSFSTTSGVDLRRTAALGTFAFVWSGPFAHFWFNAAERIVRSKSWGGVMKKVFLDQFVIGPPSTLLFFGAVGALEGRSRTQISENIHNNFVRTQVACWSVWPAIHMVTFSVIPVPLRPLFSGGMSVLWSGFVSWSLHRAGEDPEKIAQGEIIC